MRAWPTGSAPAPAGRGTHLSEADLSGADLTGADLTGTDLTEADLTGADLFGAHLYGTDLSGADLTGTDVTGAARLYAKQVVSAVIDSTTKLSPGLAKDPTVTARIAQVENEERG
ncbi:pentapeptide repeat-containing protein [Streptomyces sp. NPDC017991]|uniref:pentapeptide repeat-containing protein n=1 Tax=Streptomyces sp. NPDC017991 TaxID=3365026 RepID=UPI0037891E6F